MSDLILLGAPGSGKGTQAERFSAANGWVHLATGVLFRDHLRRDSELGKLARAYVDHGELVPDDVTVDMVRERLAAVPTDRRVVFDGFPRTVGQADALDTLLADLRRELGRVVLLEVPRGELLARIAGRATCANCQAVYNVVTDPPRRPGVCDRCGGPVAVRSDEAPEVVATRLDVFERETAPLVDRYRRKGALVTVDGRGSVDEVGRRILEAIG